MLAEILWDEKTIGVIAPCAVAITAIISVFTYKWNKTRSDNELKQSMIDRGMTADEMERILKMKSSNH